jgi:hypothetical protein
VGNTDLVISEILNADLRWEWFRRPGEVLAASLFYKDLTNPIEYITFNSGGETFYTVPENFESGQVTGWEVEAKTALDFISPRLGGLSVGFNYTAIESEVDIPADLRNIYGSGVVLDTRPLQGQPEYVLNLNLSYDNEDSGTSFGLFYNVVGDTLQSGAARGEDVVPDQFNKELKLLNFTFTQRLPRGWAVRLAAKNLLQDEVESFYRLPDGQELTRSFRETPMRISLGFSWKQGRGAGLRWSR